MSEKFHNPEHKADEFKIAEASQKIKAIRKKLGILGIAEKIRTELDTYSPEDQKNMGNTMLMQILVAGGEFYDLGAYKEEFNKPLDYESKVTNLINRLYEEVLDGDGDGKDDKMAKAA